MTNDGSDAARRLRRGDLIRRWTGELFVIVVGVLIALAADRWNQSRTEAVTAAAYLGWVAEEIRADSATLERFLTSSEEVRSARDSLMAAMTGALELDVTHSGLLLRADRRIMLPPIVAWAELNNTGSLGFVKNDDLRRTLSAYYATRARNEHVLTSVDDRTRGAYYDALYPMGFLDGSVEPDEWGAFLALPEGIGLLKGLAGYSRAADRRVTGVLEAAIRALAAFEGDLGPGSG